MCECVLSPCVTTLLFVTPDCRKKNPECVCCYPVSLRCCLLLLTAGKRKEKKDQSLYCSQTAALLRSKAASFEPGVTGVNYVDEPSVTNNRPTDKTAFVTVGMRFSYGGCFSASFHSPLPLPPLPPPPPPTHSSQREGPGDIGGGGGGVSWPLPLA